MRFLFHVLSLFVALAVLLPALTAADKKEKLIPAGELTGKLTKVDASSRHFTIQGKQPYTVGAGKSARLAYKDVNVDLDGIEDMQVRLAQVPMTLDDKGNRRKMNAKELQAYKGPAGHPGYKGDVGDLKSGQQVTVQLGKPRGAAQTDKGKIMTITIQDQLVK